MNYFKKLSRLENDLVIEAELTYGKAFLHIQEVAQYFSCFFLQENLMFKNHIFKVLFTNQAKMFNISILSAIRLHMVQSHMDLRNAIEVGNLAAYALVYPEAEFYINPSDVDNKDYVNKIIKHEKNLKKLVYTWLENNFPDHSKSIKGQKNSINNHTAHGSLFSAHSIVKYEEGEIIWGFHDLNHPRSTMVNMWTVGNMMIAFLDLFYKIGLSNQIITKNSSIEEKLIKFHEHDKRFKTDIENWKE